jgi:DNA uptake protein ComE-like DNA-binding protein
MLQSSSTPDRPTTSFRAQLVLYALLCGVLVYILIARYLRPLVFADQIAVEPAKVEQVQQRIDPNVAPWPELARLPEVGESLARNIVAYREEQLRRRPPPIFRSVQDLDPVERIGGETLKKIAPWLMFPEPSPTPAPG